MCGGWVDARWAGKSRVGVSMRCGVGRWWRWRVVGCVGKGAGE